VCLIPILPPTASTGRGTPTSTKGIWKILFLKNLPNKEDSLNDQKMNFAKFHSEENSLEITSDS
jgi:hypothetical protein